MIGQGCLSRVPGSRQNETMTMKTLYPDVITPRSFPQTLQDVAYDPFGVMPKPTASRPCVLVTTRQLARAKGLIRTCRWAAKTFARLKANCRAGDGLPARLPVPAQPEVNNRVADLALRNALAFMLTQENSYRQRSLRCSRLLAQGSPHWPVKTGGSQMAGYSLGEARMHVRLARTYDLLAADGLSEADDRPFREMLLLCREAADACTHYACGNINTWSQTGRLALALALGDAGTTHDALYGCERQGQWRYGLIHMLRHDVLSDGMHWERAPGYHFYTLLALTEAADMLRNSGVDLWHVDWPCLMQDDKQDQHRAYGPKGTKRLKATFDAPLYQAFPGGDLPLLHDSGLSNLRGIWTWGILYNLAYEAYGDPKYAWLLNRMEAEYPAASRPVPGLPMPLNTATGDIDFVRLRRASYPAGAFHRGRSCSVSLTDRHEPGADLFPVHGSALLRGHPDDERAIGACLDWAPHSAGHMSPAALHLDLSAAGRRVTDAPRANGYKDPLYLTWIRTTIAHNTVTVDEGSMFPYDFETDSIYEADRWRDTISDGELVRFQPDGVGFRAVRAANDNVYRGVRLDRTVVVTDRYVLDVYRVLSAQRHQYDLAMHGVGRVRVPAGATAIDLGSRRGYRHIDDARRWPAGGKPLRVAWNDRGSVTRVAILPPKGGIVITGRDPVAPGVKLGERGPVAPRQVAIVRARGTNVLFLSLWTFGQTRLISCAWVGGTADGDAVVETHVNAERTRWVLPFAADAIRREVLDC